MQFNDGAECQNFIEKKIIEIKTNGLSIPLIRDGNVVGELSAIRYQDEHNESLITQLSKWRETAQHWFPSQFKVTHEGTANWLKNQLLDKKDRVLFIVKDSDGAQIGHVGLFRFDYNHKFCELDNIIRGEDGKLKGAMTDACSALSQYALKELFLKDLYLRVVSNNKKAISLYEKIGYQEIYRAPLIFKRLGEDSTCWEESISNPYIEVERYFVTMKFKD